MIQSQPYPIHDADRILLTNFKIHPADYFFERKYFNGIYNPISTAHFTPPICILV